MAKTYLANQPVLVGGGLGPAMIPMGNRVHFLDYPTVYHLRT